MSGLILDFGLLQYCPYLLSEYSQENSRVERKISLVTINQMTCGRIELEVKDTPKSTEKFLWGGGR
jgi:hypothetical protein